MPTTRGRYAVTRLDTAEDFLIKIMEKHDIRSFEQVAIRIGVTPESIRRYRRGLSYFNERTCEKIAEELELPLEYVLAKTSEQKTRSETHRAAWGRMAAAIQKSMKEAQKHGFKALAALTIGAAAAGAPAPAPAGFNITPVCAPEIHICAQPRRRKPRQSISAGLSRAALGLSALARYAAATLPMIAF